MNMELLFKNLFNAFTLLGVLLIILIWIFLKTYFPKLLNWIIQNKYLQSKSKRAEIDRLTKDFEDPIRLSKLYIEPNCQQFNPADKQEDLSNPLTTPIFDYIDNFIKQDQTINNGKNQLIILADAGMGKTCVLLMKYYKSLKFSLKPKKLKYTLLKLGDDTFKKIDELDDFSNRILLLDSLDEDETAIGRTKERLHEILKKTKHFKKVIMTCRTQFFSGGMDPFYMRGQVLIKGFSCPIVYLSLFSEKQIDYYLKRKFHHKKKHIYIAKEILEKSHTLKSRPMLLAHIEDIMQETKDINNENWNEYTIYKRLVSAWLRREEQKDSNVKFSDLWNACSVLALNMQVNNKREISEEEVNKLIETSAELKHIPCINIKGRSLLNKNSKGDYRFSHYSIQEFLIADRIVSGKLSSIKEGVNYTSLIIIFLSCVINEFNLSRINLHGLYLNEVNFTGAILHEANLSNSSLIQANLFGADLRKADLSKSNLKFAVLSKANLEGANLEDANLEGANLEGAKLKGAIFYRANLLGTNLLLADLKKSKIDRKTYTKYRKALLKGKNFKKMIK